MAEPIPFIEPESVEVFVDPAGGHNETVFLALKLAGTDKIAVPLSLDWTADLIEHLVSALVTLGHRHADKAKSPTSH